MAARGSKTAKSKPRTPRIGYALSSEEHPPLDLVRHAAAAEESGFEFALISDHFHPWVDQQGIARSCGACLARSPTRRTASRSGPG